MKYSISIGTVHLILSFLEQNGIKKTDLLRELALDNANLSDPDGRIPTEKMQTLWRIAVSRTQSENLPLEFGMAINPYGLGIVSYLLMNCETLHMALQKLCHYQDVACAGVKTYVEIFDDRCQIRLEIVDEDIVQPSYAISSELAIYFKLMEALIGEQVQVHEVCFAYPEPTDISRYQQVFNTNNIQFNKQSYQMWFPAAYLARKIPHANVSLFPLFEKHLDDSLAKIQQSDSLSYKVRQEILRLLKGEEPKLIMVARALGIGERSIQLRLSKEGTSFRELLEEVRKDLAMAHLKDNKLSTTDISYLLGFSELSVFSRTFKKWTGQSPNVYRRELTSF